MIDANNGGGVFGGGSVGTRGRGGPLIPLALGSMDSIN